MNSRQKSIPISFSFQCILTCYRDQNVTQMLRDEVQHLKI